MTLDLIRRQGLTATAFTAESQGRGGHPSKHVRIAADPPI